MDIIDGRYIGNGDKNLFVKILGQGNIPVVIETGWGSLSFEWEAIQKELAKNTTVITYDRAGYAESPSSSFPRASAQVAGELYTMLKTSGVPGPYILVGHNGGGLYMQHFAKMFANEVAGMVLVDSISQFDDKFDKLDAPKYQEIMSHQTKTKNFRQYAEMEKKEFEKMIIPMLGTIFENYPDNIKETMITYQSDQDFYKTILNEMETRDESLELINQQSIFTNIPVKILCRDFKVMIDFACQLGVPEDEARAVEELWLQNSKDLLNLSTDSKFEIVKNAGHNIHIDNPAVVVKSILDVMKKASIE
ncbi:alpha/beta fold hydrolase [Bacteroidota bacterium]